MKTPDVTSAEPVAWDDNGDPLRWRDAAHDRMHAAEAVRLIDDDPRTILMRTRCGSHEVSPHAVWAGRDTLTCDTCFEIEHADHHPAPAQPAGEDRPVA
jgi:hypothetical protein